MSTLKVDGIRSNSASSDAITLASDGTCTANITNRSNRNLIINGAMQVAQRGTSSTSDGITTVDRFSVADDGVDENPTYAQVDVASGTTPYTLGFRKAFKITNGNQTSGAGAGDFVFIHYQIEGQDVAGSGWNYTSASSFITLSFWVKSSVAQNFFGYIRTKDGTEQRYPYETGSLSADTWTKITKTIPGNSNIQIDNDNGAGMGVYLSTFIGTDRTDSGVTLNQWGAYVNGTRTPDQTSTWYTTNDATFEITGVQLEVGSTATDFEHRSYADELLKCKRYYVEMGRVFSGESGYVLNGLQAYGTQHLFGVLAQLPVTMRAKPTTTVVGSITFSDKSGSNVYAPSSTLTVNQSSPNWIGVSGAAFSSSLFIQGGFAFTFATPDGTNYVKVDAEL